LPARRRVRPEGQAVSSRGPPQVVQDRPRLDAGEAAAGVDLQDAVHVLRHVDHDRDVAALTREARPCPAREHRSPELPAEVERLEHIGDVSRHDDTDRDLPVIRRVRRVERSG
jgi:hypothetical protein